MKEAKKGETLNDREFKEIYEEVMEEVDKEIEEEWARVENEPDSELLIEFDNIKTQEDRIKFYEKLQEIRRQEERS